MTDFIETPEQIDFTQMVEINEFGEITTTDILQDIIESEDNIFAADLFYEAVETGDMESAQFYAEIMYEGSQVYGLFYGENTVVDYYGYDIYDEGMGSSTSSDELENYAPAEGSDVNNSSEAMEHWEFQEDTNRCAQFSQLFVIEEALGIDIDPDMFCEISESNGWFSEEGGTNLENINKMLDYFGVENEVSTDGTTEDLIEALDNGGRVIVAVDCGEYWDNEAFWDDWFDPNGADHAIEVIGYDAETDSFIVNDSGTPDGCGEIIPRDVFEDAWEDSDNYMVVCPGIQNA